MSVSELNMALADAHRWLDDHAEASEGSPLWYGINNLRRFLAEVEADHSALGIERACHALGHHIVDQYDVYEELSAISTFNDRVRCVGKQMKWEEYKAGPNYRPLTPSAPD